MRKHFELTEEIKKVEGRIVYRVRALVDLPHHNVKAGDLGGFVQDTRNLCDEAWVADEAVVLDHAALCYRARAENHAILRDDACARGTSIVRDRAELCGFAFISGKARVEEDARITDFARVIDDASVKGHATLRDWATARNFSCVSGWARMSGNSRADGRSQVLGLAEMHDHARAYRDAIVTDMAYLEGTSEVGKGAIVRLSEAIMTLSPVGKSGSSLTIAPSQDGNTIYSRGSAIRLDSLEEFLVSACGIKDENLISSIVSLFRAKAEI